MKLKCLFGEHEKELIDVLYATQYKIYKCKNCSKYYVWHYGVAVGYWTSEFPTFLFIHEKFSD